MQKQDIIHYPSLKTVLMVESVLREAEEPLSRSEIKRRLPAQIMHQTLNLILKYLENRGMIIDGPKGILWTYNPSKKLDMAIRRGLEI